MRWTIFAIFALVFLVLETSLRVVLRLEAVGRVTPSFMASLLVFLALFAPRQYALWAALILGVLMDLSTELQQPGTRNLYVIGPYALGYVAAAFAVVQIRSMVFRRRLLTFCILTFVAMAVVAIVTVTAYTLRSWLPWSDAWYPIEPSAIGELVQRLGIAVYSALLAIPLGWLLMHTMRLWGFAQVSPTRGLVG